MIGVKKFAQKNLQNRDHEMIQRFSIFRTPEIIFLDSGADEFNDVKTCPLLLIFGESF